MSASADARRRPARVALSFAPELDCRTDARDRRLYVHLDEAGDVTSAELPGALFTPGQLRALAEASGWTWERLLDRVAELAEEQVAPWDFAEISA